MPGDGREGGGDLRRDVAFSRVAGRLALRGSLPSGAAWILAVELLGAFAYASAMQPRQFQVRVQERKVLTGGYVELQLEAEVPCRVQETEPGQFVMLRGDWGRDLINGRAFSVLDVQDPRRFSVLLKVFGRGTARLAESKPGDPIKVTGPLGQPFGATPSGVRDLLVAGGVGLPPLHFFARRQSQQGARERIEFFYGGRRKEELVLLEGLRDLGIRLALSTDDGSMGQAGRVTGPLLERIDELQAQGERLRILSCGPTPMLQAVRKIALDRGVEAFLCLEEQMACGFGACLGCAVPVYGEKPFRYCCTDGPVFSAKELRWA